ncbi:MAG: TatD family hydrolase [Bacteroidetes bacterium]|nr:TatD family hydrolase [Bacteroidota bacterium]
MVLIDTHTHLYLKEFDDDRDAVIQDAVGKNVGYMLLPNIDSTSVEGMLSISSRYPDHCFPMIGLHPGSVGNNYHDELQVVEKWLTKRPFFAIGEIGMDLYWDKTYAENQKKVLLHQFDLAIKYNLPVVIHSRNAITEIIEIINLHDNASLRGVFHCFSGSQKQADKIAEMGFFIGIGGVVTFKNSGLTDVVEHIHIKHILLETDAPYLAPVPFRGKRNQSAFLTLIAEKVAEIKQLTYDEVAEITTRNALELFRIKETHQDNIPPNGSKSLP